jgi:hypothetical protein
VACKKTFSCYKNKIPTKGRYKMRKISLPLLAIATLFILSGCSSHNVTIAPSQPQKYEVLGKAEGSASGSLGLLGTAYYFIPMGLNSRTERAYENALKSVPGATGLINVTYQEDWLWWVIGTSRDVTIKGDAIREIK